MDLPVRGNDFLHVNGIGSTLEVRHTTTGFLQNYQAGRSIPGLEIEFPKAVAAPRGRVAKIECSRPGTSYALTGNNKRFELTHREVDLLANPIRKARQEKCGAQLIHVGNVKPLPVQEGSLSARAADDFAFLFEADGNAEDRILVGEVGCAVERIDDPFVLATAGSSGFFGEDGVIGIPLPDAVDDEGFAFLVGGCYQVRSPLELDLLLAAHIPLQHIAGGPCQLDSEV